MVIKKSITITNLLGRTVHIEQLPSGTTNLVHIVSGNMFPINLEWIAHQVEDLRRQLRAVPTESEGSWVRNRMWTGHNQDFEPSNHPWTWTPDSAGTKMAETVTTWFAARQAQQQKEEPNLVGLQSILDKEEERRVTDIPRKDVLRLPIEQARADITKQRWERKRKRDRTGVHPLEPAIEHNVAAGNPLRVRDLVQGPCVEVGDLFRTRKPRLPWDTGSGLQATDSWLRQGQLRGRSGEQT